MTHRVRDSARTLEFEGDLLSHSTSWVDGSPRWVEFFLYRTKTGNYVVSRIGHSLLFHKTDCAIARRNNLKLSDGVDLNRDAMGCSICDPTRMGTICQEEPRYWAQLCRSPEAVVEACRKYDEHGAPYLTRVARRLLEEAGYTDQSIDDAYRIEHVS